MKKLILLILNLSIVLVSIAQDHDKKSKTILDDVSAKFKAYTSVKIDFSYNIKNTQEKIDETIKGTLSLKKEKYRLELPQQIIICDGKSVWTIMKDVKEIHISTYEESDDVITPQSIFTLYEKGHKSKHIREGEEKGKKVNVIELIPKESREYHKVRLNIEIANNTLINALVFDRNGNVFTYDITKMLTNTDMPDTMFTFNSNDYAKYEIIDLR